MNRYASKLKFLRIITLLIFAGASAVAATIGTNPPVEPLTRERIAHLPPRDQRAWNEYLDRSSNNAKRTRTSFKPS